jgi:predicted nucleic acid-binding protein
VVFIDTSVWFSILVPKDPKHPGCLQWFDDLNEPLITSDYIVDETLTLLVMRGERKKAIEFGNLVMTDSAVILHRLSENQFDRSWLFFQRLSGAGLSFTDCTTHIIARDRGIEKIASFDHHFRTTGQFTLVP